VKVFDVAVGNMALQLGDHFLRLGGRPWKAPKEPIRQEACCRETRKVRTAHGRTREGKRSRGPLRP